MKQFWFAIISTLLTTPAYSQEEWERGTFLCIAEMATGFKVIDGQWESVNFNAGQKYIVRPLREGDIGYDQSQDTVAYGVFEFGASKFASVPDAIDRSGFTRRILDETHEASGINATGITFSDFIFNKETMRYTSFYAGYGGAWHSQMPDAVQEEGDTPYVSLGTCSRI